MNGYYYGSLPLWLWFQWNSNRAHRAPVIVLRYQRVADDDGDDGTIPTATFRQQIEWLTARYDVVSLEEAQQRLRDGFNNRPAVSITFDTGYADNMQEALPWLMERGIPFTYFVLSRHVLEQEPFPHDTARGGSSAPNTLEQIHALAGAGVEIGAHTRNYTDLSQVSESGQMYLEIEGGHEDLEQELGCTVRYFAFPYGQRERLNRLAFHTARDSGLWGVCSAYGDYNLPGVDPFHLQRIPADPDIVRFKNRLTLDPRQQLTLSRYEYDRNDSQLSTV